jgi:hypothetical protein
VAKKRKTPRRVGASLKRAQAAAKVARQEALRGRQFEAALDASKLGLTPGWVPVRLTAMIYDPRWPSYRKVPGWSVAVEVRSEEALLELQAIQRRMLVIWEAGHWDPATGRVRCPDCRGLL